MSEKTTWVSYVKDPSIHLSDLTQPQAADMIWEFVSGIEQKFTDPALYEFMYSAHPNEEWARRLIQKLEKIDKEHASKSEFNGLLSPAAHDQIEQIILSLRNGRF